MRLTQALLTTFREAPADAETLGTQQLIRAGYLRKVGGGLYAHLPPMTRVMHRLENLIRAELDGISQEVSLPLLQPEALWQRSGRWDAYTRAEGIMFTVTDRAGRQHALGPTHEEVALDVVGGLVQSYRDLPQSVYQIGRKFRDELRPRFGLLRTREFTMKDAYSFHADEDSLRGHFEEMSAAYGRILTRLGLNWRMVEADSGAIGGHASREFVVLSDVGEDEILFSPDGLYAANAERAVSLPHEAAGRATVTVRYAAAFADGSRRSVAVSLRDDQRVNPVKLWNEVQARSEGVLLALDEENTDEEDMAADANILHLHDLTVTAPPLAVAVDIRQAQAGERCTHDPVQFLQSARGIEVGHVFMLGTKYSAAMNATFTAADGTRKPFQMGCYGIGVTRLAQAVAEQTASASGLNWPPVIAPWDVLLTVVDVNNATQMDAAEQLYADLQAAGLQVLLDDRPLRAGAKFADADLLGIPWRVTLGRGLAGRGLERGEVEVRQGGGNTTSVPLAEVVALLSPTPR